VDVAHQLEFLFIYFDLGSHSPGTGVGLGQANGGTFANAQGQAETIPIGPFGGRITLAESTSLAAGIPGFGGSFHQFKTHIHFI
jgi:hypothetical protein